MAKIDNGYLGGFAGKLGPAVGYQWNGKWCLRSKPGMVRNPRTAKQMEHRDMFRQEVQLAARMRWAVTTCLTAAAREAGMTSYNLFVSINQPAFSLVDGQLAVDWPALQFSGGPLAPVAFETPSIDGNNVLTISFVKNPEHLRASDYENVALYVYCPDLGSGFLSSPVYRRDKSLSISLPDAFAGHEVQLYGYVFDRMGRFSPTIYAGCIVVEPSANDTETVETEPVAMPSAPLNATAVPPVEPLRTTPTPTAPPNQLSLW